MKYFPIKSITGKALIFLTLVCGAATLKAQKLSTGRANIMYICSDSTISSIGNNEGYQLGDGTLIHRSISVKVKGLRSVVAVNALGSLALLADGTVWTWRHGNFNESDDYNPPRKIDIDNVVAISSGYQPNGGRFYCALKSDGSLWLWGDRESKSEVWWGYTDRLEKMSIPKVKKVEGGNDCVIALCEDGTVWTWGSSDVAGNGLPMESYPDYKLPNPQKVQSLSNVIDIGAGGIWMSAWALKDDGTVWEWGWINSAYSPRKMDLTDIKAIFIDNGWPSEETLYALNSDGALLIQKLFYPKTTDTINSIKNIASVAATFGTRDNNAVYILDTTGSIWRWGGNDYGQLGNFTTYPIESPEVMPHKCLDVDCDTITKNPDVLVLDTIVHWNEPIKLKSSSSESDLYFWYPQSNVIDGKYSQDATVEITDDTEFNAVIMDSYGCMRKERFILRKKCPPTRTVVDTLSYFGATIQLVAGKGEYYTWQPYNNLSCYNYCRNTIATITEPVTYTASFTDSIGCRVEEKFIIRIPNCDTIIRVKDRLVLDSLIVPGSNTNLTASIAETYSWTPTEGLSCTSCQNPTARIYGNTEFTATMIDKRHCPWTERFKLTNKCDKSTLLNPPMLMDTVTYPNASFNLTVPKHKEYSWLPTTGLGCSTCMNTTATVTASIQYEVSMVDSFYCASKALFNIKIRDCDTIVRGNNGLDSLITPGSYTTLTASSAETYSWTPATGLSCTSCKKPTARIYGNTEFTATMMDKLRCQWTERFKLTNSCDNSTLQNPPMLMDTVTYPNATLNLAVPKHKEYSWQPTTDLSCSSCMNPTAAVTSSVKYEATMVDSFYCATKAQFNIRIRDCDTIVLQSNVVRLDTTIHYPTEILLAASLSYTGYAWNPFTNLSCTDCRQPILSASENAEYTVATYDRWRCPVNETYKITMVNLDVVIPNVFTPNGDGVNDYFAVNGLKPNSTLQILSSNEGIVFSSGSYDGSWNGTDGSGNNLPEGTYWYILDIPSEGKFTGWVYIKR